jgi:hypothetical protein
MSLAPVQPISPTSSRPTYQMQSSKLSVTPVSINPPKSLRQESIVSDSHKLSNFSSELSFPQNPFPRPPGMQLKSQSQSPQPSFPLPNYNIYSSPPNPIPATPPFLVSNISSQPQQFTTIPSSPTPPAMSGLLVPLKPTNFSSTGTSSHALSKDDWGDFDPLS